MEKRYFVCENCGQMVEGWHASQWIDCCGNKKMVEVKSDEEAAEVEKKAATKTK